MWQPGERAPAPGRLALVQDLVNTADLEVGRDRLRTVDQLEVFCVDHGIGEVGAGPGDVRLARDLREALRAVCAAHAGVELPQPAAVALDGAFGHAPLVLVVDAGGAALRPAPGLTGARRLTAEVAVVVAAAVADGRWRRLKACRSQPCRWVYYDHSPGSRRRWCSMNLCGARAKMRAYRARR